MNTSTDTYEQKPSLLLEPRFPEVIDSTMLSCWRKCKNKFLMEYVYGLRRGESTHLIAGGAFAKGLEVTRRAYFDEEVEEQEAIGRGVVACLQAYGDHEPPEKYMNKSAARIAGAVEAYFEKYPLRDSMRPLKLITGKSAIEFTFALPLDIAHPETGNPIIFGGRTDWLAQFHDSGFIVDEKTAGQLGSGWASKWSLRGQFMGYGYAARAYKINIAGAIVRGVGLYKNDYGFEEALVYLKPWQLDLWYEQMLHQVWEMVRAFTVFKNLGSFTDPVYHPFDFGDACTAFNQPCTYTQLCEVQNPLPLVQLYYEVFRWNPLEHTGDAQ